MIENEDVVTNLAPMPPGWYVLDGLCLDPVALAYTSAEEASEIYYVTTDNDACYIQSEYSLVYMPTPDRERVRRLFAREALSRKCDECGGPITTFGVEDDANGSFAVNALICDEDHVNTTFFTSSR